MAKTTGIISNQTYQKSFSGADCHVLREIDYVQLRDGQWKIKTVDTLVEKKEGVEKITNDDGSISEVKVPIVIRHEILPYKRPVFSAQEVNNLLQILQHPMNPSTFTEDFEAFKIKALLMQTKVYNNNEGVYGIKDWSVIEF